jgi:hypothetical protein
VEGASLICLFCSLYLKPQFRFNRRQDFSGCAATRNALPGGVRVQAAAIHRRDNLFHRKNRYWLRQALTGRLLIARAICMPWNHRTRGLIPIGILACAGNGVGLDQNGQVLGSEGSGPPEPLTGDLQSIQNNVVTLICTRCHIGVSAP